MIKRFKLTVSGRVQRVGYRDEVAEHARQLNIKGTVRNLEDEITVEVIAEGEEQSLKQFLSSIKIHNQAIAVEKIESKEEKATGEFKYFKIIRGESFEELGERVDVAGKLLYKSLEKQDTMIKDMNQGFAGVNEKLEGIDEKLDMGFKITTEKLDKINSTLEKSVVSEIQELKHKVAKIEQILHIQA